MKTSVIVLMSMWVFALAGCTDTTVVAAEPDPTVISMGDATLPDGTQTELQPADSGDTQPITGPTYTADLQPIFEQVCGGCHGGMKTSGLRLTTYEGIMQGGVHGPAIVPGAPDDSELVRRQREGHFRQLSEAQLALVIEWISNGAPE